MADNLILLNRFRNYKANQHHIKDYRIQINQMDKAQLLCKLLEYHQLLKEEKLDAVSTLKGISLMEVLMERSLTPALKELAQGYHDRLSHLYDQLASG